MGVRQKGRAHDVAGDHPAQLLGSFTAYVGLSAKQFKRTTATTDKKLARRLADELEEAARGARAPERIKSFLSKIEDLKARGALHLAFDFALRHTTGSGLGSKTARGFIEAWLERTKSEVSPATWAKYNQTGKLFLAFLEGKAEQDLSTIRQDDIARFRDAQAKRVARSTANVMLKIVRIIFTAAEADGAIISNWGSRRKSGFASTSSTVSQSWKSSSSG